MKNLWIISILLVTGLTGCIKVDVNSGKKLDNLKFSVDANVPEGSEITYDTVIVFKIKKPVDEFSFEVTNVNGKIKILRSDGKEIRAILRYKDNAHKYYNVYKYSSPSSAKIIVKTKKKWRNFKDKGEIEMTIFVPERLKSLSVTNVNGNIEAMDPLKADELSLTTVNGNVRGNLKATSLDISSVNGSIKVNLSANSINVENVNGSIKLSLENFGKVDISAVNGSISVSIPSTIGVTAEANTVNGNIHYSELEELPNFDVLEKSSHSIWHLNGGNLKFRIGSGRSHLYISTVNGSISFHLRRSMI